MFDLNQSNLFCLRIASVIPLSESPGCTTFLAMSSYSFFVSDPNNYFFATVGLGEGDGVAATWTVVPVVRESEGLTITLSESEMPLRISD